MMTTRYATRTCRRSVSRTSIVFPTSNLNECGLNKSSPCGISSTHHIEKIFYQVFIPWFPRNAVWSKYSCTVSGHVIKKAESCGVFLLAVRLKWLLYFYYNWAEALNLVSPLKNTKRGNNIIKYLRNCLGHVCVGHTYICFFLIPTFLCDGNCICEREDCFSEFQALSPPPVSSSFSLSIRPLSLFLCNFVKYK